jgi:hypothetical protein
VKPILGKLTTGVIALVLLLGVFGGYQNSVQAVAASLTMVPIVSANKSTENTNICAKCAGTDAQFTITVTDTAANASATALDVVTVKVTNSDLGTLGSVTTADSNPKNVTAIETGVNTAIFTRVVTGANKTTGLVSDSIAGTADATTTATVMLSALELVGSAVSDADEAAIVGGTLVLTSGAIAGQFRTITVYNDSAGSVTTAAFTAVPAVGVTFKIYPKANVAVFAGQTLAGAYTPTGGLGESASVSNDEVKPTVLSSSPAADLVTKKKQTIIFTADISDGGAGFPAKVADLVTNNNTAGNKGDIKLSLGTQVVNLKAANFTAITDGYQLNASFTSDALLNLANKLPWWITAEDMAGNAQMIGGKINGTSSAATAGAAGASTITDAALANGAGICGTCFVGRKASIVVDGVKQTKAITGYNPTTGAFAFSAGFAKSGTNTATNSNTTVTDSDLIGETAATIIGTTVTVGAATGTVSAFATATGLITASGATLGTGAVGTAYSLTGIGFDAGTAFTINNTSLITIDGTAPVVNTAVTGANWSSTAKAVKTGLSAKRNAIHINVTDASGLDPATITPSAFSISGGHTVSSVLLVDIAGESATPAVQRVPNDIFITMGEDLSPSNEKPTVTIAGSSIYDKAGNALAGVAKKTSDNMGPKLTIALDKTLSNAKVKATISTDELLTDNPAGAVKSLTSTSTGALGSVPGTDPGTSTTQTGTMTYTKTVSTAALGTGAAGAELNLYVTGSDTGSNAGAAGHISNGTKSSAVTFELDQWLNKGFPPRVQVSDKEAQSVQTGNATAVPSVDAVDPLIVTIDFNKSCDLTGAGTTQDCANDGEPKEYTGDSYKAVTLTSAKLVVTFADGTKETTTFDVATQLTSPDSVRFTMPILSPKIGTYALTLKASDSAGNIALKNSTATSADSLKYAWKVAKAKPYKVTLSPGWNLVSIPFEPSNPAINSVISATHPASIVMSYDNGNQVWQVSRRDADSGLFTGDVVAIDASHAYFILTESFETLNILRPPLATAAAAPPVPPAITVTKGWNLVPVLSNKATPPTGITATTYFGTLGKTWLSALAWNPLTRTWLTIPSTATAATVNDRCDATPGVTSVNQEVCTGEGLWVWVTADGVLIPQE